MSSKKIKKVDQIKAVNKQIKKSFKDIQDSVLSGKIVPVRSLTGLIHCQYDEHPTFLNVSAVDNSAEGLSVDIYLRMSVLSNELQKQVIKELQEKFQLESLSTEEQLIKLEEAKRIDQRNTKHTAEQEAKFKPQV